MGTVVAAVVAFNLVCSGTTFIGSLKKENQSPYSEIFRIDLNSGRWCSGRCETTKSVHNADQTRIMLKLEEDASTGWESFIQLNREDGSILDRRRWAAI